MKDATTETLCSMIMSDHNKTIFKRKSVVCATLNGFSVLYLKTTTHHYKARLTMPKQG